MLLSKRRANRRPLLIVSLLSIALLFARYMKDFSFGQLSQGPRTHIDQRPVTVTRVRTAWARTTRTIFSSSPTDVPGMPPSVVHVDSAQKPLSNDDTILPPLEKHLYRSDGLLEVNPNGGHPIFELIERAEATWNEKMAKASKTLEEAVKEYKRRYKRDPPLGFDFWCVGPVHTRFLL